MSLPLFLKKYFWEVNFENLDPKKRADYIIERLLEYSDIEGLRWLLKIYPQEKIIEVLKTSRTISQKGANFWALYFEIPKEEILCFQKQFRENSRVIWSY